MNYFAYDSGYENNPLEYYIERQMYHKRDSALEKLSQVVHPAYVTEFIKVLAHSWFDGDKEAEKIADHFLLGEEEFLAVEGDLKRYSQFFHDRNAESLAESRYECYLD